MLSELLSIVVQHEIELLVYFGFFKNIASKYFLGLCISSFHSTVGGLN